LKTSSTTVALADVLEVLIIRLSIVST